MAKKLLNLLVHGREHSWSFNFLGDTKYLLEWRADGLEIEEVENVIPVWVVQLGLTRLWCRCQDVFHLNWW